MLALTDPKPGSKGHQHKIMPRTTKKKLIIKTLVLSPHQLAEEGLWISTAVIAHDWGTPIKLFCSVRGKNSSNFSLKFIRFGNCRLRHLQELLRGSSWVPPNPGFILLALQYSQMIWYFSKTPLRSWAELQSGRTCPWPFLPTLH